MSIKVHQNQNFLLFQMGRAEIPNNCDLSLVATVETNSLDEAYDLTQSPHPSRVSYQVKILSPSIRSTSVGDVLEDSRGNKFLVTNTGFKKIN